MHSLLPVACIALGWSSVVTAQFYAIKGAQDGLGPSGARPARLEINTLKNDVYAWPLYIQALAAMQKRPETYIPSYFEIAGIHGRPYEPWDNVGGPNNYTGYCTHDSILFPTWHRPYLALFEQELNKQAQAIAARYSSFEGPKYVAAAKTLRMPYWDWAATPEIPTVVNTPQINITTPAGPSLVDNPLYNYRFPPLDRTYFPNDTRLASDANLANMPTTMRLPSANANLAAARLPAATYNILAHISDFSTFATQSISGSSLEAVHGIPHICVGYHMSQLSYAAFDPIFWLHHANVDRIFALWQAINPNTYFPSSGLLNPYGTFTIQPGSTDYSNSSLTPFTSTVNGKMYDSNTARSMSTFGYTYPEIQDWNQTSAQLRTAVIRKVNALYNPSGTKSKRHARDVSATNSNTLTKEWFVQISVDKFELDTSFIILIFLGDLPVDPSTYKRANSLAGSLYVSVPSTHRKPKGTMTTHGEVPLKEVLELANLQNADEATVAAYLTKNLKWVIQKVDNTVVDPTQCPSLKIEVHDQDVQLPTDDSELPKYGKSTPHPEIIYGKPGSA